ncbi:hypothetical protein [Sphingosinicella rhizophila]|uniref:Uncharacterized protein n=1 Tax=Sphingosinicella rhizophila TaxID=3050082 RepID=A0ABU3Q9U3_9SPHN|nr:hypothetical protein [Sphingosinicella sp. GR2756]MDT9600176.1 hypothetical protein [Sphingosinicella sp. GR2756]
MSFIADSIFVNTSIGLAPPNDGASIKKSGRSAILLGVGSA